MMTPPFDCYQTIGVHFFQPTSELAAEIARFAKEVDMTHLVNIVSELEELSDEEVRRLLAEERNAAGNF